MKKKTNRRKNGITFIDVMLVREWDNLLTLFKRRRKKQQTSSRIFFIYFHFNFDELRRFFSLLEKTAFKQIKDINLI
jgi:hypothetical protein